MSLWYCTTRKFGPFTYRVKHDWELLEIRNVRRYLVCKRCWVKKEQRQDNDSHLPDICGFGHYIPFPPSAERALEDLREAVKNERREKEWPNDWPLDC